MTIKEKHHSSIVVTFSTDRSVYYCCCLGNGVFDVCAHHIPMIVHDVSDVRPRHSPGQAWSELILQRKCEL